MCAEKIEELPDSSASPVTAAAAKPPSAWGPAITVLVLLPVLSFVIAECVFVRK